MGNNPRNPIAYVSLSSEKRRLQELRERFARGELDLEQFETAVEAALRGLWLVFPPDLPTLPDPDLEYHA